MNPNETSAENVKYAVDAMRGEPEFNQARLDVIKAEVANRRYRENEIKWMDIVTRERNYSAQLRVLVKELSQHTNPSGSGPAYRILSVLALKAKKLLTEPDHPRYANEVEGEEDIVYG